MRFLLTVIYIGCAHLAISQSDGPLLVIYEVPEGDYKMDSIACGAERKRAVEDIQAGELAMEFYGGISFEVRDFAFEAFYSNYLIAFYKIARITTGCTTNREKACYFNEMDKAITAKYGTLFLAEIKDEARQEYEKFKSCNTQEKSAYIDFDYVYWKVDKRANYTAGLSDLQKKLKERVDLKSSIFLHTS